MKKVFYIVLCIFLLPIVWAFLIEPNMIVVRTVDVKVANWHKEHENLKIVFFGDIHARPIDTQRLRRIVKTVNAQNPDLVVNIGDYVNGNTHKETLYPRFIAKELSAIKPKYGFITTLGNHDYWYNSERIKKELEDNKINVLENENLPIDAKGKRFWIIGIEDLATRHTYLNKNVSAIKDNNPIILLSHNPDIFPKVPKRIGLTLAGNTHGGQVDVPFYGPLIVFSIYGKKYAKGLIYEDDRYLYVTTGLGTSILPVRFNCVPEIVVLKITSK